MDCKLSKSRHVSPVPLPRVHSPPPPPSPGAIISQNTIEQNPKIVFHLAQLITRQTQANESKASKIQQWRNRNTPIILTTTTIMTIMINIISII